MRRIAVAAVKFYRRFISRAKPSAGCCRFIPTCSEYALGCYEQFGFFRATLLTVWRILRCNPFSKGGLDPVPIKQKTKKAPRRKHDGDPYFTDKYRN